MIVDKSYANLIKRVGVSVTYLKNEDRFCLYYPGPRLSSGITFGQQCFYFEYYDMLFAINKLREEKHYNRYEFYKSKNDDLGLKSGEFIASILSNVFDYKVNDAVTFILGSFCLSKTVLDKCLSMRKTKDGKRKIELKWKGK